MLVSQGNLFFFLPVVTEGQYEALPWCQKGKWKLLSFRSQAEASARGQDHCPARGRRSSSTAPADCQGCTQSKACSLASCWGTSATLWSLQYSLIKGCQLLVSKTTAKIIFNIELHRYKDTGNHFIRRAPSSLLTREYVISLTEFCAHYVHRNTCMSRDFCRQLGKASVKDW